MCDICISKYGGRMEWDVDVWKPTAMIQPSIKNNMNEEHVLYSLCCPKALYKVCSFHQLNEPSRQVAIIILILQKSISRNREGNMPSSHNCTWYWWSQWERFHCKWLLGHLSRSPLWVPQGEKGKHPTRHQTVHLAQQEVDEGWEAGQRSEVRH